MSRFPKHSTVAVLRESDVRADGQLLACLWATSETFAFLPTRARADEHWIENSLALLPEECRVDHFVLMTSGSTGYPKLIVAKKSRAERLAAMIHAAQENESVRETIACLPLSYSYAFVNQWLWANHVRRRLVMTDGFSRPDDFKKALEDAHDAMICMVGIQVPLLLSLFGSQKFPGIIRLNFAGGRFPQERLENLRQIFPNAEIFNNYGCAEAMPRLTIRRADDACTAENIGRPLPGIELRSGEGDQLEFRSPFRAVAFIERGVVHAVVDDEWVEIGDLGHRAEDGSWILVGRKSEVFKRFGEKVSLPAIHEAVQRVWSDELAFYREFDSMGENGYVMVLSPHPVGDELRSILTELRRNFTRPHWPLRVESMEQLPRLPNNKIDTCVLTERNHVTVQWSQRY